VSTIAFAEWQDRIIDDPAPRALAREFERRGVRRGYVLMPQQLRDKAGFFDALQAALGDRLAAVYSALPQHSPLPDVFEAAREAKSLGCDVLVSIGGGSNIDAAKMIQYCLTLGEFDMDAVLASRADKARSRARGTVHHVCVPTTLSGAEFTYFAGGRNPRTLLKEAFVAPDVLPRTLVFDQQLATSTPSGLWLSSGLRAIDHAVEGLVSGKNHPLGHSLGLEGIARLRRGLAATHVDPSDLEARRTSQYGGWFCAIGLMTGVPMGASHAIGHVIGSVFDVPHGLTSCIALPAVMQFNYRADEPAFDAIARALGGTTGSEAPDLLRAFIASLGLPTTMTELGLGRDSFATIAAGTMHEGWARTNPRPLATPEDVVAILETML
jgi:maleylacetate reductase